ncbi:hypothetical protein [Orlajensenia flava]|nr:hypothetical protein [Glaciibacter flavus]
MGEFATDVMEVKMGLSRKRKKELKRLRASVEQLWGNQQDVLGHANHVAREAGRQVGYLTREEVTPRVRDGYSHYVQPGVDTARGLVKNASDGVVPALGNALGAVLSIGDVAKDARVRAAVKRIGAEKYLPKQSSGPGVGTYIAITAGVLAAAGVAYAVWQTFRADDELWIADEPVSPTTSTAGTSSI